MQSTSSADSGFECRRIAAAEMDDLCAKRAAHRCRSEIESQDFAFRDSRNPLRKQGRIQLAFPLIQTAG